MTPYYTKVKVPGPKINTRSAEQLCRATLPLLPYKNPCHYWPTRVCCHTLTPDWLPSTLKNSTMYWAPAFFTHILMSRKQQDIFQTREEHQCSQDHPTNGQKHATGIHTRVWWPAECGQIPHSFKKKTALADSITCPKHFFFSEVWTSSCACTITQQPIQKICSHRRYLAWKVACLFILQLYCALRCPNCDNEDLWLWPMVGSHPPHPPMNAPWKLGLNSALFLSRLATQRAVL